MWAANNLNEAITIIMGISHLVWLNYVLLTVLQPGQFHICSEIQAPNQHNQAYNLLLSIREWYLRKSMEIHVCG